MFNTASANATAIWDHFSAAPLVEWQQALANIPAYVDGTRDLGDDLHSVSQTTTFDGVDLQSTEGAFLAAVTMDYNHLLFAGFIPNILANSSLDEQTRELVLGMLNFMSSPLSGVLIGDLGPLISPWVALSNSVQAIIDDLTGDNADPTAALQELINIPANVVGGALNGATLDLDALIPLIKDSGLLPSTTELNHLDFAFGGLLTTGSTIFSTGGSFGDPPGIGGSIWNAVGIDSNLMSADGHAVGPLAAMVNLSQMIAGALGWDGSGNPLGDLGDTSGGDALAGLDLFGSDPLAFLGV